MKELINKGEITLADITRKYTQELHANEIILLSYYIAAINIEATFDEINGNKGYAPFEGIVLTDTFESTEAEDTLDDSYFGSNNDRLKRQKEVPITAIIGNPPYSAGQSSINDNNQKTDYEFGFQYEHERYKENPLEFTTYEQTIADIHEKVNKTSDNLIRKSLILTSLIFTESLLKSVISSKIPEETEITSFSSKIIKDEINANLQGDGEIREKFFRKLFGVSAPEQPWRDLRKSLTRGIDSTKIQENKIVYTAYRENESVEMIEPIDELFEKLITFCNELQQIVINDTHSL